MVVREPSRQKDNFVNKKWLPRKNFIELQFYIPERGRFSPTAFLRLINLFSGERGVVELKVKSDSYYFINQGSSPHPAIHNMDGRISVSSA